MATLLEDPNQLKIAQEVFQTVELNYLLLLTNPKGIILKANSLFCQVSGYTEQELMGSSCKILKSRCHNKEFWENFWDTILSGKEWHGEICNRKKNGEEFWIDCLIRPIITDHQISYFLSISQDITLRKQVEQELWLAQERMRNILDSQSTYLVRIDLQGNFTYANAKFLRDFTRNQENILGTSVLSLNSTMPYHQARVLETIEKCLAQPGKFFQIEIDKLAVDGTIRNTLWDFVTLTDSQGKPCEIQCSGIDYTEKYQVEQELARVRKRLEEATELGQIGNWELDLITYKMYWSPITKQFLEVTEDFKPTFKSSLKFLKHRETFKTLRQFFKRVIETGEPVTLEIPVLTAKGRELWLYSIVRAEVRDAIPLRLYGMVQDITQRKQLEEKLIAAREEAIKASQAKSQFLANMSHEIRTPLNAILGFTELLKEVDIDPFYKECIQNINLSAYSLLELVNDILDFSKIEAGKLELEETESDLYKLASEAINIVKHAALQKNLELLLNIAPEVPRFIKVDPFRLRQVLLNLLSNAVKFTEKGEVELRIRFRKISPQEGEFFFMVRDTGIGIAQEQQAFLFRAFSQLDNTLTRRYGGTGLGLVICQGLLQKMGSLLHLCSEPNEGSTFFFFLTRPFRSSEEITREKLGSLQYLLLVDSNATSRQIIRSLLEHWGLVVFEASCGQEAIELLAHNPQIQVLLWDYSLLEKEGLAPLNQLRTLATSKSPAIVLLHRLVNDTKILLIKQEFGIELTISKPIFADNLWQTLLSLTHPLPEVYQVAKQPKVFPQIENPQIENTDQYTILLVEDVELNLVLMRNMLTRLLPACEVIEARNGFIAIEAFKAKSPHLVFMDIQMPEMDGITTTRHLRQLPEKRGTVPIIALTAITTEEEITACLTAGMQAVVSKPITLKQLQEVLEKYLPLKK